MSERAQVALQNELNERRRRYTQEDREPERERTDRREAGERSRRRRRRGSLDRFVQYNLDCDPEKLDTENWVYRWVNDEKGRPAALNTKDDYDFVTKEQIGAALEGEVEGGETDGRVRQVVGYHNDHQPLYAYLMRKPREYWEEDYEGVVSDARSHFQRRITSGEGAIEEIEHGYVPKGTQKAARISGRAAA